MIHDLLGNVTHSLLLIPSLERNGEFNVVLGASLREAQEFAEDFLASVTVDRRTVVENDDDVLVEALVEFSCPEMGVAGESFSEDAMSFFHRADTLVEKLSTSTKRGARGARIAFIDTNKGIIAVGTAVVYNENRARLGVTDETVPATILRWASDN
jgi:hypothetical protein